jgi:chromosome segregation ATPase
MRVLGFPIEPPQAIVNRALSDLGAIARAARAAPMQLEQILELGQEIATIGRSVLAVAERLDGRAEAIMELGERLDRRAADLLELGRNMGELGERIDVRGAEIADRAAQVSETGTELIGMLPTLERALEMASPLEGAIDRFGRFVDRFPGGAASRRRPGPAPDSLTESPDRSTDPPADPASG